ncbi:MAG: hypothetical protein ABJB12_18235 [Pseudomonadota bacterium]
MRSLRFAPTCAVFALGCASPPLLLPQNPLPPPHSDHSPAMVAAPTVHAGPGAPAKSAAFAPTPPVAWTTFGTAPFGNPAPLLVERASPDGRWLTICQARRDTTGDAQMSAGGGTRGAPRADEFARYLLTPAEQLVHEGLLGADASGRFVLLMQQGAFVLWDSQRRTSLDLSALGADSRLSAESFAELRTVAFDATSEHVLYARSGSSGPRIVIRNLGDATERTLDPGQGVIWRARFAPTGSFVVAELISADSNKNGKEDFPAPLLATPRACRLGPERFHAWSERGDRPETVLLPLAGGAAVHEPDLLMPVRDALLLRDPAGALLIERAGKKRVLEPAACKGRVVYADPERELFIVGCVQPKKTGHVSLDLITTAGRKPLDLELASVEYDREVGDPARLVALYPGAETVLFDADKREVWKLQPGDSVIATRAARALVRRGSALVMYDADTHSEQALPGTLNKYPEVLVTPPFAFVSPVLVNVDTAQIAGTLEQRPLALSSTGQLLVGDSDPDNSGLTRGPLHWLTPERASAD